jgi:protein-S-isoprenylcysteine O-methyltransferase Ste14
VGPAGSNFALWTSVKIVVALVVVFVLARIVIPNLVNAHNTPLLLLAIAFGALAFAIAAWTAISVWRAWRRVRRAGSNLIEARK